MFDEQSPDTTETQAAPSTPAPVDDAHAMTSAPPPDSAVSVSNDPAATTAAFGHLGDDSPSQNPSQNQNQLDGPNPEIPNLPQAVPTAGNVKVIVKLPESSGAPITFNAPTYRELYNQVSARASQRLEAGSVTTQLSTDYKTMNDNVTEATFSAPLSTSLPSWPQKGQQPAADQAKFNEWFSSVETHEQGHRDIYKREYNKLKAAVVGPKTSDCDTQRDGVDAGCDAAQTAYDAKNQPAPLAVPGGIEHVPRNSTGSDDAVPAATGDTAQTSDAGGDLHQTAVASADESDADSALG
jgi:hypothetical protein